MSRTCFEWGESDEKVINHNSKGPGRHCRVSLLESLGEAALCCAEQHAAVVLQRIELEAEMADMDVAPVLEESTNVSV